ncbi:MAG: flagellar filament capping protein FliD [Roseburia sp.]|nr:flagellar filament capping protein FliD [Roseburia sp.]MCM1243738.1 flagellar filament capping protein FliD [Roseburia sp.]
MAYYNSIQNHSNVYNYYMTTYAPKSSTPYDTHKKSELRSVYNSIVKMNKDAPIYILDTSKESCAFAVGMKENARELRNTIAALGNLDEDELLNKKAAYSSNENIASASYIGRPADSANVPSMEVEVRSLATSQVNMGNYLPSDEPVNLPPATYSFDISIDSLNYEFQFNIKPEDTNKDVQERLSRLINNANIGIFSKVMTDSENQSAMRLESNATGLKNDKKYIYEVSDHRTSKNSGTVEYLGLDYTAVAASNADFSVNGEDRTSPSNKVTIDRMYEITLNGVSSEEGETASIGLKTDVESLTENINTLVRGYNSFLRAAAEYSDKQPKSNRLVHELGSISRAYAQGLTSAGLNLNLDGTLEIDNETVQKTAMGDDAKNAFSSIMDFTHSLVRKSNQIALDPMNYVNNIVVAYKNPGKNFATPYITSAYSGMMFNSYC